MLIEKSILPMRNNTNLTYNNADLDPTSPVLSEIVIQSLSVKEFIKMALTTADWEW